MTTTTTHRRPSDYVRPDDCPGWCTLDHTDPDVPASEHSQDVLEFQGITVDLDGHRGIGGKLDAGITVNSAGRPLNADEARTLSRAVIRAAEELDDGRIDVAPFELVRVTLKLQEVGAITEADTRRFFDALGFFGGATRHLYCHCR